MATLTASFGAADANVYCVLTQAHSLIGAGAIDPSPWTSAATAARVAALLTATRDIDAVPWLGSPSGELDPDQALAFPRTAVGLPRRLCALSYQERLDRQRDTLAYACATHALALLAEHQATSTQSIPPATVKQYSYRLGGLSETYVYDRESSPAAGSFDRFSDAPRAALAPFPRARRITRS